MPCSGLEVKSLADHASSEARLADGSGSAGHREALARCTDIALLRHRHPSSACVGREGTALAGSVHGSDALSPRRIPASPALVSADGTPVSSPPRADGGLGNGQLHKISPIVRRRQRLWLLPACPHRSSYVCEPLKGFTRRPATMYCRPKSCPDTMPESWQCSATIIVTHAVVSLICRAACRWTIDLPSSRSFSRTYSNSSTSNNSNSSSSNNNSSSSNSRQWPTSAAGRARHPLNWRR